MISTDTAGVGSTLLAAGDSGPGSLLSLLRYSPGRGVGTPGEGGSLAPLSAFASMCGVGNHRFFCGIWLGSSCFCLKVVYLAWLPFF